jgi:hypothetical protein
MVVPKLTLDVGRKCAKFAKHRIYFLLMVSWMLGAALAWDWRIVDKAKPA